MTIDSSPLLIVITGPTASGKTSLAVDIALALQTEILSADSRQFYKEMRIGTATPAMAELKGVPHHFLGHISIHDEYNVSRFEADALRKLGELFTRRNQLILAGGSGLYINAVCYGIDDLPDPDNGIRMQLKELYRTQGLKALQDKIRELDPDYYDQADRSNPKRLLRAIEVCLATGATYSSLRKNIRKPRNFKVIKIGLMPDREILYHRINQRVGKMMEEGFLQEAKTLYPYRHLNALNTVGYKELFEYLDDKITLEKAVEKIRTHTRRYAKRQLTWFRRDTEIRWFHPDDMQGILNEITASSW
jgi:tRNA dimethylallyltransferase